MKNNNNVTSLNTQQCNYSTINNSNQTENKNRDISNVNYLISNNQTYFPQRLSNIIFKTNLNIRYSPFKTQIYMPCLTNVFDI